MPAIPANEDLGSVYPHAVAPRRDVNGNVYGAIPAVDHDLAAASVYTTPPTADHVLPTSNVYPSAPTADHVLPTSNVYPMAPTANHQLTPETVYPVTQAPDHSVHANLYPTPAPVDHSLHANLYPHESGGGRKSVEANVYTNGVLPKRQEALVANLYQAARLAGSANPGNDGVSSR